MPALIGGFGNFLLPLGLGGPDMGFPRLNNISYLSLIPSIVLFLFAGGIENGVGTGWTLKGIRELFYGDIEQSKLFSMREYLQVNYVIIGLHVIHYSCLILITILLNSTYVRMCMSRRQCAWIVNKCLFTSHQRLNEEHLNDNSNMISLEQSKNHNAHIKDQWEQWLVGFTDGDGNFHISHQGDKWGLSYKLTQSRYNLRVLHYIKKQLGVGSITKDGTKGQYFIRDRKIIETVIIPIFDKYPLLTTKYFDYVKLKKALVILNNTSLSKEYKNLKLLAIKNSKANSDYISPAWNNAILPLTDVTSVNNVMSKSWLVGFIEAEGSFYLTNKDSNRIVHQNTISPAIRHINTNSKHEEIKMVVSKSWLIGFVEAVGNFDILKSFDSDGYPRFETEFKISQHHADELLLYSIKRVLHIKNSIKFNEEKGIYFLSTKHSKSISNIINLFSGEFKGMKSLEFRLWTKANFFKDKNPKKLIKLSDTALKVKNKHNLSFEQKRNFTIAANTKAVMMLGKNKPFYLSNELIKNPSNLTSSFNIPSRNYSTGSVNPVVSYTNADTLKLQIIQENRNKSGIYRWTNHINGKSYIGSSSNLGERFYRYFNINYLIKTLVRTKSSIYSSLLKNGYSNFKLEILEYCEKTDLLSREQYYIDKTNPAYNILLTAYSSLGFKHTEDTKNKMSDLALGREFSKETRAKISSAKLGQGGHLVKVVDKNTGNVVEYVSINQAAKAFGVRSEKVRRCILNKTLLFEQYMILVS